MWAKKCAKSTPSPLQKSETVFEVPADIHLSRYNAMIAKATATSTRPATTPPSATMSQENKGIPELTKKNDFSMPKDLIYKKPGLSVENTAGVLVAHINKTNTPLLNNATSNVTVPGFKLDGQRIPQEKREDFCQQANLLKLEVPAPRPSCAKPENSTSSTIPEGCFNYCHVLF